MECSDAWGVLEQSGLSIVFRSVGLVGEQQAAEIALGSGLVSSSKPTKNQASTGRLRIVVDSVDPFQRAMGGQARIKIPSTEKCSELSSGLPLGTSSRN